MTKQTRASQENMEGTVEFSPLPVPRDILVQALIHGITRNLLVLLDEEKEVTIEFQTPHFDVFDIGIRLSGRDGSAWIEGIISSEAAQAICALLGISEEEQEAQETAFSRRAKICETSHVLDALDYLKREK